MKFIITYTLVFILFLLAFFKAKKDSKHDYIDIAWGLGFLVTSIVSYFVSDKKSGIGLLVTILVVIWAIRLSSHLIKRNVGKAEDRRYVEYRENYKGNNFDTYFFFRMYLIQYILNLVISFPVAYMNIINDMRIGIITILGVILWAIGFYFESVGDEQLKQFKEDPINQGKLMTEGLWALTRHPNYFGESMQWWGIYVISLSKLSNFWLIFSPIIITYFLLFISGVPLLEKKYEERLDWKEYASKTPKFFPSIKIRK